MRGLLLLLIAVLVIASAVFAKNRDTKDYPQKAKVVSFEREKAQRLSVN